MAKVFEKRANIEIRELGLGKLVGFSAGFAIYEPGDTSGSMIDRASADMLENKASNKELRSSNKRHPSSGGQDQEQS
jgi:hypothetical protein